jgi:hypothetical protein
MNSAQAEISPRPGSADLAQRSNLPDGPRRWHVGACTGCRRSGAPPDDLPLAAPRRGHRGGGARQGEEDEVSLMACGEGEV